MPKTTLRQFTGGISNEIDPQNLREDQGEEALDINLKGFALEPGEVTDPISSGGHYYYRGEWIRDSKAVSFEESGIGVIKTYDDKRPEFEEIIKDDVNVSRRLGPPLPPSAVITGTVVSEGTRGERPAEGSHLLKVPETALGEVDKVVDGSAPSLDTHQADATTEINDIHYYDGQPFWVVRSSSTSWLIRTRQWSTVNGIKTYLSTYINSSPLTHFSKGGFFKEGFFVCWDNQYIETVPLSSSSMSIESLNTIDSADNGDAGTAFLPNAGKTASSNFTTGATSDEITGVDINNGIVSFSQRITTANTLPTENTTSAPVAKERWLRMPTQKTYVTGGKWGTGCFVVLIRDGQPSSGSEASTGAVGSEDDDLVEVWTDTNKNEFKGWTDAKAKVEYLGASTYNSSIGTYTFKIDGLSSTVGTKAQIEGVGVQDLGFKYSVVFAKNQTWVRVLYKGAKLPEIIVMENAVGDSSKTGEAWAKKGPEIKASMESYRSGLDRKEYGAGYSTSHRWEYIQYYKDYINYELIFPSIRVVTKTDMINTGGTAYTMPVISTIITPISGNRIHWRFAAPTGSPATTRDTTINSTNIDFYSGTQYPQIGYSSFTRFKNTMYISDTQSHDNSVGGSSWTTYSYRWSWARYNGKRSFFFGSHDAPVAGSPWHPPPPSSNQEQIGSSTATGTWTKYLGGFRKNFRWANKSIKSTAPGFKNVITGPAVPGKMHRLCSYTPGSSVTQQHDFGVSELWTTAIIRKPVDGEVGGGTIDFAEAGTLNFRKGDYIKVSQNGSGNGLHLNLPGKAYTSRTWLQINSNIQRRYVEQTFFTAQILKIEGTKLHLSAPEFDFHGTGKYLDEVCYPKISSYIEYSKWSGIRTVDTDGPECKVFKSDLSLNVLIGHGRGRHFLDSGKDGEFMEVRPAGGGAISSATARNYTHLIDWKTSYWSNNVIIYKDKDIRAVNAAVSPYDPRIFYVRSNRLYSQDGSDNTAPGILSLSANGKYYADKNYVTYVDNKDLTIFSTDLQNAIFYKGRPKLASGLGLTGEVTDARTYVTSTNAVYVLAQIGGYWKLVKTSNTKPEVSLLSYDFKKPLAFDGSRAWGVGSLATGGWDIQTVIPFYESNIIGSWIFYANDYTSLTPSISAWGEVVKSRLGASDDNGTPRYLSIDWKMDSGNWFGAGTPTIGLNDDSGKMVNENTFKWYPRDIPSTLVTSSTGTVISNIANNTYSPVAELEIPFKSKVIRDIVFFKQAEGNSLPAANSTGSENQLAFINYQDANQAFYVINNNAFDIAKEAGKEPEWAYKLAQSDLSSSAFDASKVGVSSFLIGAPNMFNPYGPQIDFYYMASFINKWGLESAPSPLPSKGVTPLDSADDCIQINFSAPFFRLTDTDTETIRIYRYGGDSSEFLFLRDIPMPKLPEVAGVKSFPVISGFNNPVAGVKGGGSFARKSSTSPYYLLKTNYNISSLGEFINSNFDFVTTPTTSSATSLDGSWRVNELSENEAPSPAFATTLTTELTAVATTVVLTSTTAPSAWPTSGVIKIDNEYIAYTAISSTSLTGCTRGIYNSNAAVHKIKTSSNLSTPVTVVEWVLEMEHRNQDTSELKIGIDTALTGSSNVITVASGGTSVFPASGDIMIGSEIFSYTSKTTSTFVGVSHSSGSNSTHLIGALVRSYNETYTTTDLTNTSISIDGYGYRDKSRTPIASLYTIQKDNWPPLGLEYNETKKQFFETEAQDDYFRYIKAVGSMHFGALDGNLRFSKYGTPEYWPLEAVLTLDSEIRWIEEHGGEGIVFTTNSVYRVRGTDPKAMVAFRIPDAKGIPAGYEHTVAIFNGGLLWLTAGDGIAMYHAGKVTYLTRDKHSISQLKFPYACSLDGVYWLFQRLGGGTGYRLEVISGEIRLGQTSVEAYYAYFAKALGIATVVTKDNIVNIDDTEFIVEELGGAKAKNITWKSKKIDAGEPTIPKALGSIEIVYEALSSSKSTTIENGIRGQALAAELLGLNPEDLDAGDINSNESESVSDLYDIFTKYDQPNQAFIIDTGGDNLTNTQRRTIIMPVGFDTSTVTAGDRIWNQFLADNTVVESLTTETISSVIFPAIVLNKEPLRTGSGVIYWGNLPLVEIYINDDITASRIFTLPPSTGEVVEAQSMDLYLNDLRRFRTISVAIQGDVRVQALSLTHYPLQRYQSQTLHHSADVFYRGDIDFRVMLDGDLIYRKNLSNDGDDFKEERVYLPASSFGQRAHYMNESRTGMIESVNFNGSVAA